MFLLDVCLCVWAGIWFVLTSVQCQVAVLVSVSPRALTLLVSNERAGPSTVTSNLWLQISSKMWLLSGCCWKQSIFVYWNSMSFKPRAAYGCLKYRCLQVEDAQESACLVAFSCQTRDILEDRPAIKNRKNAQTCLDVPLVTDYSSLAYYHPFFQGCGDVKKHVCACSQLLSFGKSCGNTGWSISD